MRLIPSIALLLLTTLARAAQSTPPPDPPAHPVCDAWIGEFTLDSESVADHRIQKQGDQYVLQVREKGQWHSFDTLSMNPANRAIGADGKPVHEACVLTSKDTRLIKVPAGSTFEGKHAETGFLVAGEVNSKPALLDVFPIRAPSACEEWVGDFRLNPNQPPVFRIEKQDGDYVVLSKDDQGKWDTDGDVAAYTPHDVTEQMKPACTLAIPGGFLIRVPAGTTYQATAVSGSNWGNYTAATGFLLLTMQGFQVDGHDLYPVASISKDHDPISPKTGITPQPQP